ncbi:MAG TPA: trypsin-like peptidase domain-containing protein [Actinokineospora sp.]|nr:trypsin-like peptidase domain-containing protein [Actinokineospora sp.]
MTDDMPGEAGQEATPVNPWSAQAAWESGNLVERVQGPDHQAFDPRSHGVQGPTRPGPDHGVGEAQGLVDPETGGRVVGVQGPDHPDSAETSVQGASVLASGASTDGRGPDGPIDTPAPEISSPDPLTADAAPQPPEGARASATTEQVLFGTAFTGHHSYAGQPVANPYAPPHVTQAAPTYALPQQASPQHVPPRQAPPRRPGGLVAGMTVLALIVGGAAGAAGGYLVADSRSPAPSASALDAPKPAKQASAPATPGSVEAVAQKVLPSVVQLQVRGRSAAGEGSGFVISEDGLIVTNNHVVEAAADGGSIVAVFQDGRTAKASIVGRDPSSDLAVVRAQGVTGLTVAELGRSDDLKVGQSVVAIGSPFELSGTVTSGIVSSLRRPTRAGGENGSQATVMDAIQTDAAINPGNSGGPLADMQGRVIGINSAIYSPRTGTGAGGSVGIGFAIPIDQARRTADEIVKTGKATQTVLGVSVRDNPDGGALISEVVAGGAGERAGLKSGEVITMLDDRRIDTSDALVAAVRSKAPGDKVKLVIGDGARTVEATLAGQSVEPK